MRKLIFLFFALLTLTACDTKESEKVVTVDKKYSISIPSFLTKVSNLNDDASLQYQHAWKEFYVIVIDETKSEMRKAIVENGLIDIYSNDLNGYSDLLLDGFGQFMLITRKTDVIDTHVNNMPAKLVTVYGEVDGIDVFYSLAFIEGKKRYYNIVSWSIAEKEYQYKDRMKKLIYSFNEL